MLPVPGCRNVCIKAITVPTCCLQDGTISLTIGRNVVCILCLLSGESHPLPTSQAPGTPAFHLQTADGSLSLLSPLDHLGPSLCLPGAPEPSLCLVGPASPHRGPGAASHCAGPAVPPAGHLRASPFLLLSMQLSFLHSEEHWPTFGSAPPPWRRSPGHGPFPLPAPAARWRPHSAFRSGLLGW